MADILLFRPFAFEIAVLEIEGLDNFFISKFDKYDDCVEDSCFIRVKFTRDTPLMSHDGYDGNVTVLEELAWYGDRHKRVVLSRCHLWMDRVMLKKLTSPDAHVRNEAYVDILNLLYCDIDQYCETPPNFYNMLKNEDSRLYVSCNMGEDE